mgnify:FL=1
MWDQKSDLDFSYGVSLGDQLTLGHRFPDMVKGRKSPCYFPKEEKETPTDQRNPCSFLYVEEDGRRRRWKRKKG